MILVLGICRPPVRIYFAVSNLWCALRDPTNRPEAECASELFNASRLCPACETPLTEPDDVVICSLHPSNDYKTSVLSGLTPSIILEICSRAISFWQYQIHQEKHVPGNSFQQAVVRNMNEKNAQLQKQFDNVVREANSEISLLTNKTTELEQDLEVERRKVRELQEVSRERDKEYQKLKAQHDKIKRKALLTTNPAVHTQDPSFGARQEHPLEQQGRPRTFGNVNNNVDIGAVIGGMETNGIQRTPIVSRTGGPFAPLVHQNTGWNQHPQTHTRNTSHRHAFAAPADHSYRSTNASDRSESANEVEHMLTSLNPVRNRSANHGGWVSTAQANRPVQRVLAPSATKRMSTGFRPAR
ncbi:hypothetical protein BDQ12DRAFT_718460 [Crucibulum laeve]|uniref:E3 ubiquitin-protein ligase CCNB1IP1 n=1 Tax=Crucibulum laeve TaxID=68775 RepID=A0A5C3MF13_9AGAR|nr:hypothetical protein BDQ12DRAFT_718460 [Crucibulum laeve]